MADKVPVRVVFNDSDVATGLAEYQSGETVPLVHGGIGVALSIGTAGQVLKVNSGASALEFGNVEAVLNIDGMTDGSGITILDADKFAISDGGTEKYVTASVIKTYVGGGDTSISHGNSNVTVVDAGTGNVTIEVDGTDRLTIVAATTTTATGHSLVIGAASNSVGGYIKILEGTDNGIHGVTIQGPASTADVTLTLPAATDTLVGKATTDTLTNKSIDLGDNTLTGSLAEFNSALQSESFASLTGSETLTNKTLTTPIANAGIQLKNGSVGPGFLEFFEDSDNGTNKVTVIGPASTADVTITLPATTGTIALTSDIDDLSVDELLASALVTESEGISSNDNDTTLPTSAAVKDFVDTAVAAVSTTAISQGNSNITVTDAGTGSIAVDLDGTDRLVIVAATTTTATGHSLVMGAASSTVGGQIKFLEGTNNGTNGVTLQGPASTADVTVTLPAAADTLVGKATTDTLTNKSIDLATNTITGSLAEFNSALQSESFASLTGSETLTNKTLTTPVLTTPIANAGIQLKNAATSAGFVEFFEDSDNGTNKVTLIGPASTADVIITLPAVTGTVITTANSDGAATTTSSSDADFVLVDDGGVMKKITTTNLGIVNSLGIENSSFLTAPGTDGNFDLAKIQAQTGSAESGLTTNAVDAFGIPTGSSPDQFDTMDPKFQTDTVNYGSGEAYVGA